jgi:hypothetical protein
MLGGIIIAGIVIVIFFPNFFDKEESKVDDNND